VGENRPSACVIRRGPSCQRDAIRHGSCVCIYCPRFTQQEGINVKRIILAAAVAVGAVLFAATPASAHEVIVVCDEATGELVWSNEFPEDGPVTVVTSNGLTVDVPAEGSVRTIHPGPGTWTATWEIPVDGVPFIQEGPIPAECVETTTTVATTTTAAPTTTVAPTTAPPTSEAASRTVAPPRTLPDTGTDLTVALVGAACVAIGALATIVTRRRASTR
jgi:hypothetical protein